MNVYIGIDIGSVSVKGVVIDKDNNIIDSYYLYTNGDPTLVSNKVINRLKKNKYNVIGIGTTGNYRKSVGKIVNANVIKNEIECICEGSKCLYPEVNTIFDIGGSDFKIINVNNGNVIDYGMNYYETSGIGKLIDKGIINVNDYDSIISSFLDNVIEFDIKNSILVGGLSLNKEFVNVFNKYVDSYVIDNSHLVGAIGVAIMSKNLVCSSS